MNDKPLAFILWHRREHTAGATDYESHLEAFHGSLENRRPDGFLGSESWRFHSLGWIRNGGPVYEDWYLIEGFSALGLLNQQAVATPHAMSHDAVAGLAESGVGGLYQLEAGGINLGGPSLWCYWLTKPKSLRTPAFVEEASELARRSGASLWRRQLNMSPAVEYCFRSDEAIDLPWQSELVRPEKRLWPPTPQIL